MKNIKIITDASCDLPKEVIDKYDINVVNIDVSFDEEVFTCGLEVEESIKLDNDTFYEKMGNMSDLPKTACPSPERFMKAYDTEEENVLVFTLTSKLSATYSTAVLAKDMFLEENPKKNIVIIDSETGTVGTTQLIIKAFEMIEEGKTVDEIVVEIEKAKNELVFYGTLDTLENTIKGGRISPLKGGIINALNFKAIIHITEGVVKPIDKARGEVKSLKKVIEYINNNVEDATNKRVIIAHGNCYDKALKVKALVEEGRNYKEVLIAEIGPVMGTYTAKGAILVAVL